HARGVRRDPEGGRLSRVERRREERAPEPPDVPVEVDGLAAARPQTTDDRERLLEPGDALRERDPVGLGVLALAVPDTEDGAAARQVVERDECLREGRL